MARDLLIGAVPPVAITDIHYFVVSIVGGLITFWWYPRWQRCDGRSCCSTPSGLHCSQ
jgi:uncharacterized membrane protein YeiH